MNKKNLISQMVNPVNHLTINNLPAELVELSEENLQQVVGGKKPPEWTFTANISYKDGWGGSIGVSVKLF
jgi:bacteriocin leader peptide (microcyclamide/patellamide family)